MRPRSIILSIALLAGLTAVSCVPVPAPTPTVTPIALLTRPAPTATRPPTPAPTVEVAAAAQPTVPLEQTVRPPGRPVDLAAVSGVARAERFEVLRVAEGAGDTYAPVATVDDPEEVRRIADLLAGMLAPAPLPERASEYALRWRLPGGEEVVWGYTPGGLITGWQDYFHRQALHATAAFEALVAEHIASVDAASQAEWTRTESERFRVSLAHPAHWEVIPGYDGRRLGGPDGFLQMDAAGAPEGDIDALAVAAAEHRLQPYGTRPTIEHLVVAGRAARLIVPSADQPAEMAGEAQLIVAYPEPLVVGEETYDHLVVYGDLAHLREVLTTIQFPAGPAG